jgi:hypothetical protein
LPAIVAAAIIVVNARIVVQVCSLRKFSQSSRAEFGRFERVLLRQHRLLGLGLSFETSLVLLLLRTALGADSSLALIFLGLGGSRVNRLPLDLRQQYGSDARSTIIAI